VDTQPVGRAPRHLPIFHAPGPRDVVRAWSMARFAPDIDLRPRAGEPTGVSIVVLAKVGGMTLGTHVVPILLRPGPVKLIAEVDLLAGIEMKPALPARGLGARIPGDAEGLQPAIGERDEILLQRIDAKSVLDLVITQLPIGTVGVDVEPPRTFEERRSHARV